MLCLGYKDRTHGWYTKMYDQIRQLVRTMSADIPITMRIS